MDTSVLIVGAGPVGLTLALSLGKRGIDCTLIEKKPEPQFLPKMERCNARTMEIYRRLGVVDRIRDAGLDADIPMDVFIILSLDRPPLIHDHYPSVNEAREIIKSVNDGSQPLEPYQLISQYTLEPLLKAEVEALPGVTVRFGCELDSFDQDGEGVTARVRAGDGSTQGIRCKYMVGCDGGGSTVRKQLDIKLRGEGNLKKFNQALFRCDELYDRMPIGDGPGHGRHYHVADAYSTFLIMQDSTRHWTLHATVDSAAEMKHLFEKTIALPLDYEMLYCGEWQHNLLLADRYREGRVFLAGDAVHLVIPTGGLGMNSGVGDAYDLAWKLAGTLLGWGGPWLLDSYEQERRQVGDRNVGASRFASVGRLKWRDACRPEVFDDTPAGKKARQELVSLASGEHKKSNSMIGAELGYRYIGSPVIFDIPGGPEHHFTLYEPTTWPGARLPHVWLDDGSALQDRLPQGYVLLRLGGCHLNVEDVARKFRNAGAPFSILDVPDARPREVYGHALILLRPDMHIVWRGNRLEDMPEKLVEVATGHLHHMDT